MAKAGVLATALLGRAERKEFQESFEVTKPAVMSGFRGMFGEAKLSAQEQDALQQIVHTYGTDESDIEEDIRSLSQLTSEIRAISNQSLLLHGERIQRARELLRSYREGAFTAWLNAAYGNRQTPYSILQYYELYTQLAVQEQRMMESLPKKAAYTLAAREGSVEEKVSFLQQHGTGTQKEVIAHIRTAFPKKETDRRSRLPSSSLIRELAHTVAQLRSMSLSPRDRERLVALGKTLLTYAETP